MTHRLLNWKECDKWPRLAYDFGICEGKVRKDTQNSAGYPGLLSRLNNNAGDLFFSLVSRRDISQRL